MTWRPLSRLFRKARKPEGFGSGLFLRAMNLGHTPLSRWGLSQIEIGSDASILDLGCGGGRNLARMLERAPRGSACGLDFSEVSVREARRVNRRAVADGRCEIRLGNVQAIPWPDASFDLATAFETVYFWPDWPANFREVGRVLKPGGIFAVVNSLDPGGPGPKVSRYWLDVLELKETTTAQWAGMLSEAGFEEPQTASRDKGGAIIKARKALG
ncbi:MAG: class I SAM-dependent methyltransferase [Deltaproteobacteria bacterium]|jgi:ubiquinone/menaquinone biosynthesis C-methylase UbiE|nr:class I SAM-dependent methyltransferase [Deltaproteobacteria bacterium]